MLKLALYISIFTQIVYAQFFGINPSHQKGNPYFDIYLYHSYQTSKSFVHASTEVPYADLIFKKTEEGFSASYDITIFVFPEESDVTVGYVKRHYKLFVSEYAKTVDKKNKDVHSFNLDLEPGKFRIESVIRDLNSQKEVMRKNRLELKNLRKNALLLSDIIFYSINDSSGEKIIQNSNNYSREEKHLKIEADYVALNDSLDIELIVTYSDLEGNIYFSHDSTISGRIQGRFNFPIRQNYLQKKTNKIKIKIIQGEKADSVSKIISFYWVDTPETISDLRSALDAMKYIAPKDSIDYYAERHFNEAIKYFTHFWKERDPDKNTNENELKTEFFKRVEIANKAFGYWEIEGYKSDPGRIYIKYGEPDYVDQTTTSGRAPVLGILWTYIDLKKKFLFVHGVLDPKYIIYETD